MSKRIVWVTGVVAVLALLAFGWSYFGQTGDKQRIDVLLDWQAEPTYLGVFYARATGEFRDRGLTDVKIESSNGANQAAAAVAAGKYLIATASGGATVLSYNGSSEVVSLGVLYPRIPTVVYGLAGAGVKRPEDLLGKRIGIYPGSITKNEFDAFVTINKLDRDKLKIESISGPDIPLLKASKLDAVLHYPEMSPTVLALDTSVPLRDRKRVFELSLADYGVMGYGLNIITSRRALREDGDKVRRAYEAIIAGYRNGCADPEPAVASFCKEFPEKDPEVVKEGWDRVKALIGGNFGNQDEAGWQATIDLYRSLDLLTRPVTPKEILP
jgi:NitT/TauT family transport system substrate-binding protein